MNYPGFVCPSVSTGSEPDNEQGQRPFMENIFFTTERKLLSDVRERLVFVRTERSAEIIKLNGQTKFFKFFSNTSNTTELISLPVQGDDNFLKGVTKIIEAPG